MPSDTIEQALHTFLNASTEVTGTGRASKVYFMRVPSTGALPYVSYFTVDGDNLSLSFSSTGHGDDVAQPLVQIDVWSDDRYKGNTIGHAIVQELNRYSTLMDGLNIINIQCRGPQQIVDPDYENMYHFVVDADIEYERS